MQKKDIIDLIKYHAENNERGFTDKAYYLAQVFDRSGDTQLAEYIMAILSGSNAFAPQSYAHELKYFTKIENRGAGLLLPDAIADDLMSLVVALNKKIGIHRILFDGEPGTGKTESVAWVAKALGRELMAVNISDIIDSKLGQTAKNLGSVFDELRCLPHPDQIVVLFDEIDALALDRINSNDLREMGRVTSALLKELDTLSESIVLIATTNLYKNLDRALTRRFDAEINFDRYAKDDLVEIGVKMLKMFQEKAQMQATDSRLSRKVFESCENLPLPGVLINVIRSSVAFANSDDSSESLRRLYKMLNGCLPDAKGLKLRGFSIRQIGELIGASKNKVSQELIGAIHE